MSCVGEVLTVTARAATLAKVLKEKCMLVRLVFSKVKDKIECLRRRKIRMRETILSYDDLDCRDLMGCPQFTR